MRQRDRDGPLKMGWSDGPDEHRLIVRSLKKWLSSPWCPYDFPALIAGIHGGPSPIWTKAIYALVKCPTFWSLNPKVFTIFDAVLHNVWWLNNVNSTSSPSLTLESWCETTILGGKSSIFRPNSIVAVRNSWLSVWMRRWERRPPQGLPAGHTTAVWSACW